VKKKEEKKEIMTGATSPTTFGNFSTGELEYKNPNHHTILDFFKT